MEMQGHYVLFFIALLACSNLLSVTPQRVEAFPETKIYADPPVSFFAVNGSFTIDIDIANVTNLYGGEFQLTYNTTILENTARAWGEVVTRDPNAFKIDQSTSGNVWMVWVYLPPATSFNGGGRIATLTFKGLQLRNTTLDLHDTKLGDNNGDPIVHSAVDGYAQPGTQTPTGQNVTVTPTQGVNITFDQVTSEGVTVVNLKETGPSPPPGTQLIGPYYDIQTSASFTGAVQIGIAYNDTGLTPEQESALQLIRWDETVVGDINLDGIVDVFDLIKVGIAFGSKPGDPRWNPGADLKQDGIIDVFDLIKVGINFGKTSHVWVTVTSGIDTVNNVIYGETPHLSIFGVRG